MVRKQFRCNTQSIEVLKEVQKQVTGMKCGLQSIANATSIVFGMDPTKIVYSEKRTHENLVHCFTHGTHSTYGFCIIA